jgi:hypothetical protein
MSKDGAREFFSPTVLDKVAVLVETAEKWKPRKKKKKIG